jgi:hypothetical protein
MGDERLSNLSLLHIHRTRNLSVEDGGVGMIRVDFGPISETVGCTKLRNEIQTQRTKRNETLRNATKYTKMRNETQRNEIY